MSMEEFKVGDKVLRHRRVAYMGGPFPEPVAGEIILEGGELHLREGRNVLLLSKLRLSELERVNS